MIKCGTKCTRKLFNTLCGYRLALAVIEMTECGESPEEECVAISPLKEVSSEDTIFKYILLLILRASFAL
jgi:hypothetical protein